MANEKKYYWLKLFDSFYDDIYIRKLRKTERGDTCIVIYHKLLLTAMKSDGVIKWKHLEDSFAGELAFLLNEEVGDVEATLEFLLTYNLAQSKDGESFLFPKVSEYTGSEAASTKRSRDCRERRKALQCNTSATPMQQNCNTEIEKDIDIDIDIETEKDIEKDIETETEKETETERDIAVSFESEKQPGRKYGEYNNVLLSDEDMRKLKTEFPYDWSSRIERLSSYMASSGKTYNNHLATIRYWARDEKEKGTGYFNDGFTLDGLI